MNACEVLNCAFHNWYPQFKKISVRSKSIDISDEVLYYISSDGITLPSDLSSDQQSDCLKNFFIKVAESIKDLGGNVIPKFTWSVPQDAKWISHDKSLKCCNLDEVILLIKSSDVVTHDIEHAFDNCQQSDQNVKPSIAHKLNLRKWIDIVPSGEFRCFVKNNKIIGISQRHCDTYFDDIMSEADSFKVKIVDFFEENIQYKFRDSNFVFDVYIDKHDNVKLLDFNAFNSSTESLLFSWEELKNNSLDNKDPTLRLVESDDGIMSNQYQWNSYPVDFLHLSTGLDYRKLIDIMQPKDLIQSFDSEDNDIEFQ